MSHDPAFILYALHDLTRFAEENCRSEIALHLQDAQRHVAPYISHLPPPEVTNPQVQIAKDVLDDLVAFAGAHGLGEMRDHLLAARRKLLTEEPPGTATREVVTFPVQRPRTARRIL